MEGDGCLTAELMGRRELKSGKDMAQNHQREWRKRRISINGNDNYMDARVGGDSWQWMEWAEGNLCWER